MTLQATGNWSVRKPPPFSLAKMPAALAGQRSGVLLGDRADVEDVHHQQIPGLGPLNLERPAEHVHARQRSVQHVLGRVVVVDRAVEPLPALHPER
jgi:hypothetical protein